MILEYNDDKEKGPITRVWLRILTEHIYTIYRAHSRLHFECLCSLRILGRNQAKARKKITTRAYGDMRDKNFSTSQIGVHAVIDPEGRIIALRLFDGVIKVINLNSSNKQLTATTQVIISELSSTISFSKTGSNKCKETIIK